MWDVSRVGSGHRKNSCDTLCFYQTHVWRTVLPIWPIWAYHFYSIFYNVAELRKACFRQAHIARAVLPPSALLHAKPFALPPSGTLSPPPNPTCAPFPILGFSENCRGNFCPVAFPPFRFGFWHHFADWLNWP